MHTKFSVLLTSIFFFGACDTNEEGTIRVTAYGESFIENGIPASNADDAWEITFQLFEVTIEDIAVAGTSIPVSSAIDLSVSSSGEGHELGSASVSAGDYTNASFTITRIAVDGTATKDGDTKTFSWVFHQPTRYTECETTTTVRETNLATFQITVHADHLFYDSLVSEDPKILFQALADADTNADDAITQSELTATGIGAYDPGNEDDVRDLWGWLVAQSQTLGHVNGEGHCRAAPVN